MSMDKSIFLIILILLFLEANILASERTSIYNVSDHGATGDGKTLDTKAIQEAIDQCAKEGGKVYLPSGIYLSGSLRLKSNVTIEISGGATLLGSTNIKDYEENIAKIRSYNDSFLRHSLLYAEDVQNITITGRGVIDGQGGAFEVTTKKKPDRYKNRPYIIRFINCKNVLVENIRMQNSAMWMQHYLACNGVVIRGIQVFNHCNKNNDMIDIDGCQDVVISDCIGDSDDDALTIKSTSEHISENIAVTNCVLSSHCNAIKLGTESIGGFKNIVISNCVVKPSKKRSVIYGFPDGISGITLGLVDGGILDGIMINNIRIDGPKTPIFMRLGDRGRVVREDQPRPVAGVFRNVSIENIIATGADTLGCSILGLPDRLIENISLSNIRIEYTGGAKNLPKGKIIPEMREIYPETTRFGKLPAYGIFIRHVKNINLNNIEMHYKKNEERSFIVCDDVQGVDLVNVRGEGSTAGNPLIHFINVREALISASRPLSHINTFLKVEQDSDGISLIANDLRNAKIAVETDKELPGEGVKLKGNVTMEIQKGE